MKVALIYRCFNQEEVEKVKLSIETFKNVNNNPDNEYNYYIYGGNGILDDSVIECSYYDYLKNVDEVLNEGYDLVCLASCECYFHKSLEGVFSKLLTLDNEWQIAGNIPFSYYSIDNDTNYKIAEDGDENLSTKFMIINPLEMYNTLMEYFVVMLDDGIDDEDYGDIEDEVNEFFGNDKEDFYSFQDLLLNSLNFRKIILPEIVYDTGYNIKNIKDGIVYILNLNNENGFLINNNLINIGDLFEFVNHNESVDISDKYYKLLEEYALIVGSSDLDSKHKMERLEGKIALQEWDVKINTQ